MKILSKFYLACGIIVATIKVMLHYLASISHNLPIFVEHGGYAFLFITTVLEGIPIIGQFVPGHTVIIICGFLARLGVFNVYVIAIISLISAMLGDIVGFYLGRKYGLDLLMKFGSYIFIKKEYIEKAKDLVNRNTAKTIILGRFSPITRPLSPFIVGASGIHSKKFWLYDSIGVLLWTLSSILIGYIFGASYHAVSVVVGKFILIAILIGILVIWGYRFINKQFHVFAKYEIITLFINLFGLYLFFKTVQDAITDKVFLLELDLYVNSYFLMQSVEPWITIMNVITNIFSPTILSIVGLMGIVYFFYKKHFKYAILTTLSIGGGNLFIYIIKNIVERVRPYNAFIIESGYSFPSGHAVVATIFLMLIIYIFAIKIKSLFWREISIVICVLLILITAFSRVYLGVHWLSDVFAGIGFGLFWSTLMVLFVKYVSIIFNSIKSSQSS